MKVILNSKTLLEKLQYLSGIISIGHPMPILENFLFQTVGGELKITGSDLDNTISTFMPLETEATHNINIAIPGKLLIEILKTFPHQPLAFNILENNTVEIVSASGNYSISYAAGDEYPKPKEIETPSSLSINSKVLAKAISKTVFATGTDDLRPIMTGVLFQMSPLGTNFVATDAHKLVKYSRNDVKALESVNFVIPKKPLNLLKTILSAIDAEVSIEYNETNAKFIFEDYVLVSRLIDGIYPAYEKVIPTENPNKMIVNRSSFLNSVKCVSLFSNKTTHQICLKIAGTELNISAEDVDYSNKADERLTCGYEGEDLRIGFNARFLTEMLSNIASEEIQLEMSVPNRAGIITCIDGLAEGENILMLVMPVQLNN